MKNSVLRLTTLKHEETLRCHSKTWKKKFVHVWGYSRHCFVKRLCIKEKKKNPFIPWQGTRFRLHHLDNTPDSDLTPPTHLSMKAVHTRYRRLKTTLGWLPLVLALMNGTHRSHAAHLSEWPSLPAQLKSGDLPHSHCQLKYPVRTQTGNKTK